MGRRRCPFLPLKVAVEEAAVVVVEVMEAAVAAEMAVAMAAEV